MNNIDFSSLAPGMELLQLVPSWLLPFFGFGVLVFSLLRSKHFRDLVKVVLDHRVEMRKIKLAEQAAVNDDAAALRTQKLLKALHAPDPPKES